jgi:hypothetical protein
MSAGSRFTAAMIGLVWGAFFLFDWLVGPDRNGWIDVACLILEGCMSFGFFLLAIIAGRFR